MLKIGSCFSGIGGLDVGAERAGLGRTVFQIEWKEFQAAVLERHWPGIARARDIETANAAELPRCDILIGGFPCTGFSREGNGEGLRNVESHRWFDMLRIITAQKPLGVIIENVISMLQPRFERDVATIYKGLEDLGYVVDAPICISSAEVLAPQRRERAFIVATRGTVHAATLSPVQPPLSQAVKDLFPAPRNMPAKPGEPPRTTEKFKRIPHKGARIASLGNSVVPDVGREIGLHLRGRLLGKIPRTTEVRKIPYEVASTTRPAPVPLGYSAPARYWPTVVENDWKGSWKDTARGSHWTINKGEHITDALWDNDPADFDRPLSADWAERLMGFPPGWTAMDPARKFVSNV